MTARGVAERGVRVAARGVRAAAERGGGVGALEVRTGVRVRGVGALGVRERGVGMSGVSNTEVAALEVAAGIDWLVVPVEIPIDEGVATESSSDLVALRLGAMVETRLILSSGKSGCTGSSGVSVRCVGPNEGVERFEIEATGLILGISSGVGEDISGSVTNSDSATGSS